MLRPTERAHRDQPQEPVPVAQTVSAQGDSLAEAQAKTEGGPRLLARVQRELTRTGTIVGTPLYMAPELFVGSKHAQPAADIFSLGVIAFEVLTGQMPFDRPALLARALREEIVPPSIGARRPDLPSDLAKVLDRALSPEPINRPSAAEIAVQLALVS